MRQLRFFTLLLGLCRSFLWANEGFDTLPADQVHQGDYFVTGGNVEILGVIKGDLFALGSRVIVRGRVEGDVVATGGTIELIGQVLGNARLVGGEIELNGSVGRNVTAIGGNVTSDPLSNIGGNVVVTSGVCDLAGTIQGNLRVMANTARLLGRVEGNLKGHMEQLRLGPSAFIGGNLEYSSGEGAQIDQGAQIDGKISYTPSKVNHIINGAWGKKIAMGSRYTTLLMRFVFSFVIGWLLLRFFPKKLKATILFLQKRPFKSLGIGLLVLFLAPLACIILFISILGFPLALALTALTLLGFYTAKVFPIFWLSNKWLPRIGLKKETLFTYFIGLTIFTAVSQIPTIGGLLSFVFTLFGLGALVLSRVAKKTTR